MENKSRKDLLYIEDGVLCLDMGGITDEFVDWYWATIDGLFKEGFIEAGRLECDDIWEAVRAMMLVLDVLGKDEYSIPNEIIGEFAKRGYGEFHPGEKVADFWKLERIDSEKDD